MQRLLLLSLVCLALIPSAALALPIPYTSQRVDVPGSIHTEIRGINDLGHIVGTYTDANGRMHGFVLADGTFTTIDFPGGLHTRAYAINNHGQILGDYCCTASYFSSFLLSDGAFTPIDVPGSGQTIALGINDDETIVGFYDGHGFLLSDGAFSTIDVPGSLQTFAIDINNLGEIVGGYLDVPVATGRGTGHGFLMSGGTFTTIDIPSSLSGEFIDREINTTARGLNDRGQIVGDYSDNRGAVHGFSFSQGAYITVDPPITIDPPGGHVSVAEGVSDDAQVVGYYNVPFENGFHGFIATPVVEQDTTPPVISGMPSADCILWPPNHKLVHVATVTATDGESGIALDSLTVNASSNEPFDTMDIVIMPDGYGGFVVELRAARLGHGEDRLYTLTASAADLAGNRALTTATCVVPHDQHGRNQSSTLH